MASRDLAAFKAANVESPAVFFRPRDREPGAYVRLADGRGFIVETRLPDVRFAGDSR
jgi:hypothetical protein